MKLHEAQKQIVRDTTRFRVVNAGRRFGKTLLAIEELVYEAVNKDNANIAYVAPTYAQAREISWELLKKRVLDVKNPEINETRLEMVVPNKFGSMSKITLKGWESIESLRGQTYDFLVLDEVAMYRSFQSQWQEVIRPTLTDRRGRVLFISTPKGFNHWYDLYNLEQRDKDYKSFHFTTYDNPFVPKDEIDKQKEELTEDRFAQEINADFRKTEGLVYKEFDRAKHLYQVLPNIHFVETIAGVDPGFTNPCAVPTIKVDADDNYWVDEEYYKTGQTDAYNADFVASKDFNKVYPDPENAGFVKELLNRKVNVREVIKGKGSIATGINKVKELFKANRIKINIVNCPNLIYELETYSYPDKKDLHNEEENPIDENNHAVDALRYALTMHRSGQAKAYQYRPSGMNANAFYPIKEDKMAKQFIPRHG
jgi:PBSX family phage terminase large subunit